jgi:hypothetical protein
MGCSKRTGGLRSSHQTNGIQPGPCPFNHETGQFECPPPTEIVCIKVDKVYESCRKVEMNTDITDLRREAEGEVIEAECKDVQLVVDEDHPFICEKIANTNRVRVSFFYRFRFKFEDQEGVKTFTSEPIFVQKTVFMDRADEKDLVAQCEVFLECVECFVSGFQEVTCCIGKLIVFKLVALVQLLVPAYGFCPEPDLCPQVEAECPEFDPGWPPFPPQEEVNG